MKAGEGYKADGVERELRTPKTLRVGNRQITISDEEASILFPLINVLRSHAGMPFELDRPACFPPPPPHVQTPRRLRGTIDRWLSKIPEGRRALLEREILDVLTIRGLKLEELERMNATGVELRGGPTSNDHPPSGRVFRGKFRA